MSVLASVFTRRRAFWHRHATRIGCSQCAALMAAVCILVFPATALTEEVKPVTPLDRARLVIEETRPLEVDRGDRIPFIVWPLQNVTAETDDDLEDVLKQLADRGIAVVTNWNTRNKEASLNEALRSAAIHKKLGIPVVVNSTSVMSLFFNGDESTAHVTADGETFFDLSHSDRVKIGCPFAAQGRYNAIREQVEFFVKGYHNAGMPLDIVIADWEIDGPIEWNDAWGHAKRCARCRENIPNIENFGEFQAAYRIIRSEMQRECYAKVVRGYFPEALVGNYAVYPHNGLRYWYDYFEDDAGDEHPYVADQQARYRPWFHEYSLCRYTFGMPVVYTWYRTFDWYDFENPDYRWFYNMLLVASNAGRSAGPSTPLITFVHWHTTAPPKDAQPHVQQFSEVAYQELLWHILLRGHDGLAMWCRREELAKETRLVQEVYAAALQYKEFLDKGEPVTFDVPTQPGPVVSGLRLGDRVLVRRTDFDETAGPVELTVDGRVVPVPRAGGECQILRVGRSP
jgi:hypothetical protein